MLIWSSLHLVINFAEGIPREVTMPLIQPYPPMDNAVMFDNNALPSEPT